MRRTIRGCLSSGHASDVVFHLLLDSDFDLLLKWNMQLNFCCFVSDCRARDLRKSFLDVNATLGEPQRYGSGRGLEKEKAAVLRERERAIDGATRRGGLSNRRRYGGF